MSLTEPTAVPAAVATSVAVVRCAAELAVTRRLDAGFGFGAVPSLSQIYLDDDDARERLARDSLRPRGTHAAQLAELSAELDRLCDQVAASDPLAGLASALDLSPPDVEVCRVALGYALDRDVRALCDALGGRAALAADVCAELCGLPDSAMIRALRPGAALRAGFAVDVGKRGELSTASIALSPHVVDWVLGTTSYSAAIDALASLHHGDSDARAYLSRDVTEQISDVVSRIREQATAVILIQGPQGAGKLEIARRLADELGAPLAAAPLHDLCDADAAPRFLAESRLLGAVPYMPGAFGLYNDDMVVAHPKAVRAIEAYPSVVVLATRQSGTASLPLDKPMHTIVVSPPQLDVRKKSWQVALEPTAIDAADVADTLATRYVIGAGAIREVMHDATAAAGSRGEALTMSHIEHAISLKLSINLGSYGSRIARRASFDNMVLPDDVLEPLRDLIAMVRGRSQILEKWGYGDHLGLSRGVSALFSGKPGTGKTMAASVISSELGLELYRVDLAGVVSKWVGETEKHLAKIFDEAQNAQAMLLFDEADSLFGKRTEVKTSTDRYANLEINYILQRMESFDGVTILTTNQESAVDQAFMRRLNFRVRFPEPDSDEREALWRALLPPKTGLADDYDFSDLADRFEMTGGHIRNAIVRAAVIASREERQMRHEDLVAGAHHEYYELGKVMPT